MSNKKIAAIDGSKREQQSFKGGTTSGALQKTKQKTLYIVNN